MNVTAAARPQLAAAAAPEVDFTALYQREFDYVWHTLRRLGARAADLPDLTHDVFVTTYRRRDAFDPARPARPWLFGIAFRVASDHFRRARTAREIPHETIEVCDPSPAADEHLQGAQERQLVQEALLALDLDRRAVLIMHDIDGHPMPEIAAALAVPVKTLYSRLRVAREDFVAAVHRLRLRRGER